MKKKLYIGTNSGTSFDGIDIVLSNLSKESLEVKVESFEWSKETTKLLKRSIVKGELGFTELLVIDELIAIEHADAINNSLKKWKLVSKDIEAIGFHGQTIWHDQSISRNSLQWGDPNRLAKETQIPVVADLRRMDMAYGGQGAPIAPLIHSYLYGENKVEQVVLNLGGIANISLIKGHTPLLGFDTGPASCIMDELVQEKMGVAFDEHGNIAKSGQVINSVLKNLLSNPFFKLPSPKSTGRELFNLNYIKEYIDAYPLEDIMRTLVEFTAISISNEINVFKSAQRVIVVGGGVYNTFLMEVLSKKLNVPIVPSSRLGVDPKAVEGLLMAYLAKMRINKERVDLRSVTGTSRKVIPGALYLP